MLKTQSGKRQREKLKNARATARSMHTTAEGHVREVVEEPAHDFRFKGAVGKGSLLETVFHVREAGYEVEKRVVESRAPLVRTSTSTGSDSYYAETIPIPSRPVWDPRATAQQVQEAEDEAFEEYLQRIYEAYPPYRLNHFEHNLHVWRQLWRVVDISDILVLVADARHPQFHVPPSLYDYIVHQCRKPMLCVLNKIDFISSANLAAWIADFKQRFPLLTVVPFSSFPHEKTITNPDADVKQEKKRKAIQHEKNKAGGVKGMPPPYGIENLLRVLEEVYRAKQERDGVAPDESASASGSAAAAAAVPTATGVVGGGVDPSWRPSRVKKSKAAFAKARAANRSAGAVDSEQLMATFKQLDLNIDVEADVKKMESGASIPEEAAEESAEESEADNAPKSKITIGTIGHPNVGKSSLINALIGRAAVTVSETPGKTKHLQTLALNERMELCDCPGLVFPAVDMPRALQVLCGIFPISQLREPYTSVAYLASRIAIEKIYGLVPPTAQGILEQKGIDVAAAAAASVAKKAGGGGAKKSKAKRSSDDGDGEDDDTAHEEGDMFSQLQLAEATEAAASYQWSAWDICEAYARARNYSIKGSKGLFDTQRAANDILHDALSGVVLLTFSPPNRQVTVGGPSSQAAAAASAASAASAPAAASPAAAAPAAAEM